MGWGVLYYERKYCDGQGNMEGVEYKSGPIVVGYNENCGNVMVSLCNNGTRFNDLWG